MTIFLGIFIGFLAGILSGMFGIGGATIIIPALIYFFSMNQHQAQGTAIAALLPPVGILAAIRYYYAGNVLINVALLTSLGFLVGGLFGAMIAHPIPDIILRRLFSAYLIIIAVRLLF